MACSSVNFTFTFTTAFLALRRTMLHQHNPQYGESCAYDRNSKKTLTLRLLMSYIYVEHPFLMFLDHTHNDAAQSVGLLWTSDQLVAETST